MSVQQIARRAASRQAVAAPRAIPTVLEIDLPTEITRPTIPIQSLQDFKNIRAPTFLLQLINLAEMMINIDETNKRVIEETIGIGSELMQPLIELLVVADKAAATDKQKRLLAELQNYYQITDEEIIRADVNYPEYIEEADTADVEAGRISTDDEILKMMWNDDIEGVRKAFQEGKWDPKEMRELVDGGYEDTGIEVSYLDIFAQYGSAKCFRFAMANGTEFTTYTAACSIMGGNLEIIRLVHMNRPGDFETDHSCLAIAILFHRQAVIDWLIELGQRLEPEDIQHAIKGRNYLVFLACLVKFQKITHKDLMMMVEKHNSGLLELTLKHFLKPFHA